jgi:hypothetical protein
MEEMQAQGYEDLYVWGENPFTMLGLPLNFYGHNRWNFHPITSHYDLMRIRKNRYLVFAKHRDPYERLKLMKNCKNIYLSYPEFALEMNISFIKLSKVWSLYECKTEETRVASLPLINN